ncbi:multidrug effflux MFS transporter [Sulfitobacter sp. HNIBRBA2951]|uniref:multidrug effflux MFS transporter n=1 Tax=Sulfitobacter aquimarinus TaxID=3158557 RepID=UPI0032DECC28
MSKPEFIALLAMMMASIAFSIDAMLPALPQIGAELSPDAPQHAPLILSFFLFGMGAGTFFTGPLSDAFGRKPVILVFALIFITGALIAWISPSLEMVLAGRVLQGLGAAGPRVVSMALVRDRFSGRQMARIVSVVMMIFTLVPAVAPLIGAYLIAWTGWRGIFLAFVTFTVIYLVWMLTRLPETLPKANRRPLRLSLLVAAVGEMMRHRVVALSIVVQTLVSAMLFLTLMLVQPIYDTVYGRADEFPFWFCVIALLAGLANLLNALLVVRLGMQRLVMWTLGAQIVLSGSFVLFGLGDTAYGFYFFVFFQTCIFFQAGLTIGNLNAIAMEPMGHIAGMAASVMGAISTVGAVLISGPIGTWFPQDHHTLAITFVVLASLGFGAMRMVAWASESNG